jgi:hypothetical protein
MPICDGSHERPALCKSWLGDPARFPGNSVTGVRGSVARLYLRTARAGHAFRLAAANRGLTPHSAPAITSERGCRIGGYFGDGTLLSRDGIRHCATPKFGVSSRSRSTRLGSPALPRSTARCLRWPRTAPSRGGACATEPCGRDLRHIRSWSRHPRRFTNNQARFKYLGLRLHRRTVPALPDSRRGPAGAAVRPLGRFGRSRRAESGIIAGSLRGRALDRRCLRGATRTVPGHRGSRFGAG